MRIPIAVTVGLVFLAGPRGAVHAQEAQPILVDQIAWVDPPADPPVGVGHDTFHSASMDLEVGYSVYLPPGYEGGDGTYPVVYWLHGRSGSEADTEPARVLHEAIEAGVVEPMVLVFPNGGVASGYVDNPNTGIMSESVILDELIPHIEENYRVSTEARGRGISGFSMGGAGALRFAIRHPQMWRSVVSVAGVLVGYREHMERNFIVDPDLALGYDLFATSIDAAPRLRSMGIRLLVGTADTWAGANRRFAAHLGHQNLPIDYVELPGISHDLSAYLETAGRDLFVFHSANLEVD
jgi:enterochelin esterase-like enzyme